MKQPDAKDKKALVAPLPAIDVAACKKRESEAYEAMEAAMAMLNPNASAAGQACFDALSKTLDCSWSGDSINVLDQVSVDAPYTEDARVSLDGNKSSLRESGRSSPRASRSRRRTTSRRRAGGVGMTFCFALAAIYAGGGGFCFAARRDGASRRQIACIAGGFFQQARCVPLEIALLTIFEPLEMLPREPGLWGASFDRLRRADRTISRGDSIAHFLHSTSTSKSVTDARHRADDELSD